MKAFPKVSFSGVVMVGGALLASLAFAAEPKSAKPDAEFMTMDADKDGKISANEHAKATRKMFDAIDANGDGQVTAAEMDAAYKRGTGKKAKKSGLSSAEKIKVVDTDRDGIFTAAEHAEGSSSMFGKMDTDRDGFLTKSEFDAGYASMLKKPARSFSLTPHLTCAGASDANEFYRGAFNAVEVSRVPDKNGKQANDFLQTESYAAYL